MIKQFTIMIAVFLSLGAPLMSIQSELTADTGMDALCLSGMDPMKQIGCVQDGPFGLLAYFDQMGITFPPIPLPVRTPDTALAEIPYYYAKLN